MSPYKGGEDGNGRRIYVGNLPTDIQEKEIEDIFFKYGKISFIDIHKDKFVFAFVEFDSQADAEDAIKGRDGYNYDNYKLRVEFPKDKKDEDAKSADGDRKERDSRDRNIQSREGINQHGQKTYNKSRGPSKRTDYRIIITGLPRSGSWQDIKDHMREAGDVSFSDVFRNGPDDGVGVVEFTNEDDMLYALKNLDDTKFKSHEGETSYVKIKEDVHNEYQGKASRGFRNSRNGGGFDGGRDGGFRNSYNDRRDDRYDRNRRSPPRYNRGGRSRSPMNNRRSPDYSRGSDNRRRSYSRSRSR